MEAEIIKAFFILFVAMGALGNLPVFWDLTQKLPKKQIKKSINHAFIIASILLLVFLLFGTKILNFFGISFNSFKVAGGIILLIFGIKIVMGLKLIEKNAKQYDVAAVPMATPLITGPAVITTIIILVNDFGFLLALLVAILNLVVAWVVLRQTELLFKIFGRQGSDVMARIMGLMLTALAIEFIKQGWAAL